MKVPTSNEDNCRETLHRIIDDMNYDGLKWFKRIGLSLLTQGINKTAEIISTEWVNDEYI